MAPPPVCTGSIGDRVFVDRNGNGVQDAGDTYLNGVTLRLRDGAGVVIATTVSGPGGPGMMDGYYQFSGLCAGSYTVEVDATTLPPGVVPTLTGLGDPTTDSNTSPASVVLPGDDTADPTIDFGYLKGCSGIIGNFVWNDANRDGIQQPGELGISGVTVQLFNQANGALVASTVTDGFGNYVFRNLCPGTYRVVVDETTVPAGFVPSPVNQGDPALDSDPNGVIVPLIDTERNTTIDFGYNSPCTGTIGDFVWHDLDRDGLQDPGEPGINGVRVWLRNPAGQIVATAVTGPNPMGGQGYYSFQGLCAGNYSVEVDATTLPPGMAPSAAGVGPDRALDSNGSPAPVQLTTDASHDPTIDFGYNTPCTGTIGDFVWLDSNRNGIQDAGEPGIDNVRLQLVDAATNAVVAVTTSGPNGYYQFSGLCSGSYRVVVVVDSLPAGVVESPANQGGDDTIDSDGVTYQAAVSLPLDSTSDQTIDFGYNRPCAGTIGDFVWNDANRNGIQDAGELGIDGVTVQLRNRVTQDVLATTTTGPNGFYQFAGLCAGSYEVVVVETTLPAGYVASPTGQGASPAVDSNPNPETVSLPTDFSSNPTIDFGYNRPCAGRVGDFVWLDVNRNGIQDAGEGGIPGVTVYLRNATTNEILATDITDASGLYLFEGLCAGSYVVEVEPTTLPQGVVESPANQGGNDAVDSDGVNYRAPVTLPGDFESNLTIDFGYNLPLARLGDRVWEDLNGNGIQDPGEPGIPGVLVRLYDCSGTFLTQTTTVAGGLYGFTVEPGSYRVQFVAPAGTVFSPVNQGVATDDSDAGADGLTPCITLAPGQNDPTWDAGVYRPASLGDFVWNDLNGDGIQGGPGENGVAGVTVRLFRCGAVLPMATTVTNASGLYFFGGLTPGSYFVEFVQPAGYTFTTANAGGNDAVDSDADQATGRTPCVTLVSGEQNLTIDAGVRVVLTCGLDVTMQCAAVPPPPSSTFECGTPIDTLTMRWTGGLQFNKVYVYKRTANLSNLAQDRIQILTDSDGGYFEVGDVITASGYAAAGASNDVDWVLVDDTSGTPVVVGTSRFHRSCSDDEMDGATDNPAYPQDCGRPEGNGKGNDASLVNDWLFNGMSGSRGTLTCTAPELVFGDECTIRPGPNPSCSVLGKPTSLTFRYNPAPCTATNNGQGGKATCSGAVSGPVTVTSANGYTVTPTTVNPGGEFTVSAGSFSSQSTFTLAGAGSSQTISIHTSCSQVLEVGDIFGSMELVAFNGDRAGAEVVYRYTVRNTGSPLSSLNLVDSALGLIPPPNFSLATGATRVFEQTAFPSANVTSTATVQGVLANGQTCQVTSNGVAIALPCGLESGAVTTSGKQLRWMVSNTDTQAATISGLTVSWPAANGYLNKVKLDGDTIWDVKAYCVNGACSATIPGGQLTSDTQKKSIPAGGTRMLVLEFDKDVVTSLAAYEVTFSVNASCSLSFDGTQGCAVAGGRSDIHDKEFRWPLTNDAERTTISSIQVTWPAANGYLDKVKLDGDTIWDGTIACTGGVCSATISGAQFTADINKKSISTGQTRVLKLVFQSDASADLSAYTVSVNFHAGCAVSYTPPPPQPTAVAVCSDLKPIDGIALEFSSMLAQGRTVSSVQWYRTTVSNLASPNAADLVGSHGPIASGEVVNFNGFAARSATNDVDFVVTLSDGVVVRSRFHRSCSDSAMNDIADCGSPQGDGKSNDAGPNIWLLRNLSGNGLVLGCPAP